MTVCPASRGGDKGICEEAPSGQQKRTIAARKAATDGRILDIDVSSGLGRVTHIDAARGAIVSSARESGVDDSVGGGFNAVGDENPAGTVMVYIHTDDLAATVSKVREKGGTVLLESYEIPTVGTMATFKDPTGNVLALLQPAPEAST